MSSLPFQRLTVIGLGLIGGSLAMAARETFPTLWIQAVEPDEATRQRALAEGLVDEAVPTLPQTLDEQQLVVIACHLPEAPVILEALAPQLRDRKILVTDVGSCKRALCTLGERLLPEQFIGGHLLAGKEVSGFSHATTTLIHQRRFILCPSKHLENSSEFVRLHTFLTALGLQVETMDADTHDRTMAAVSHLPQLYSILLTNLLYRRGADSLLPYRGSGIEGQLRLAASSHAMWAEIFRQNQDYLRPLLQELVDLIQTVDPLLDQPEALVSWFERANEIHRAYQA